MAAVPAGYEAFHSLRRKGVTLLCFLLASSMAIGITVFVDSYSVREWQKNIDVGEVAITVDGYQIENYLEEIRDIRGITKADSLRSGYGSLVKDFNTTESLDVWGDILTPDAEFRETFPNYIQLEYGRFPENSSEVAIINSLRIYYGLELNDTLTLRQNDDPYHEVSIVGFYSHEGQADSPYFWRFSSIAIVTPDVVSGYDEQTVIMVDVDRSRLSAFNPTASLQYLNRIDETIRRVDPTYTPGVNWPSFHVQNRLSSGITAYINWVQMVRIAQMLRASSVLFLLVLVNFLAIRHNVNERRYEENMLISRGAARGDLEKSTTREVFILAIISCILGIPIGLALSRIAMIATGFFVFDSSLLFTEPILISLDSLVISGIVTVALPMLTLGGYRTIYSTKKNVDENIGKLAKISRGLNFIRWDVLIVGLSALLLSAMLTGGTAATSNSILSLILPLIPIPLFLGIASLSMKGLRYGANGLSKLMKRFVGDIPASIGIRKLGKGASSAGAAAMILVLAICLSWNSAIIDASIPLTAQNQSRLSVGADLTFALNEFEYDSWDEFVYNVSTHELTEAGTIVSETYLYLSTGYEGGTDFIAVNPREYMDIGYDYKGTLLNESDIAGLLDNLESTPDGAIISEDVALAYDFEVGDTLRATTLEDDNAVPINFRILGITEALPTLPERDEYWNNYDPYFVPGWGFPYYSQTVGTNRILVNREYLGTQLTLQNTTNNFLCIRTRPNANASIIATDVFNEGGEIAVYQGVWEAVSQNVNDYLSNTEYLMERSIDTMLTVLTVGTIVGGFTIYAVEGIRARRREIALLRSVGASTKTVVHTLSAEMLVLMLFSMFLLSIYAPLFLTTTVHMAGESTTGYIDSYLIPIFPVVPWLTFLVVLSFFFITVSFFIIIIAALSSKIDLASTLNAAWAEAGPYGGDM